MRRPLPLLFLGLMALPSLANDRSIVGIGGRVQALRTEHPQIRMVKEKVQLTVRRWDYDVVADFWFANDGPATAVLMGFPESGVGDIESGSYAKKSGFHDFKSWVDGRPLQVERRLTVGEENYYQAHWVKTVAFRAKQLRHIRVAYRSPVGSVALPGMFVEYPFTGGNWKGLVDHSLLIADFQLPADYQFEAGISTPVRQEANRLIFEKRHWQAQENLYLYFSFKPENWE